MNPKILHIYSDIYINSYGLMIAIGIAVFFLLALRHPIRKKIITSKLFLDSIFLSLITGIVGGRALYAIMEPQAFSDNWLSVFLPWVEGYSLFGTIIGLLITIPIFLKINRVPVLPFLDLVSIYAPLTQSIARIGCFLAGCCYGRITTSNLPWSIVYTNSECLAPLNIHLHPAQIYSSLVSLLIFILMYFIFQKVFKKPGQLFFTYLFLECNARFIVDFWRGERQMGDTVLGSDFLATLVSPYQLIVLFLLLFSIVGLIYTSYTNKLVSPTTR